MSFCTSAWKIENLHFASGCLETHLEGEGDGLGDAGEVDQDGGAHCCSQSELQQHSKTKMSVCLTFTERRTEGESVYMSVNWRALQGILEYIQNIFNKT